MNEYISDILSGKNLKASFQRIKILEYLSTHPCHPSAEMIFCEVQKEIPTISKSTVYSTLSTFVEAGILREITIEDSKVRYEYRLKNHGHFKCDVCGNIYDFNIDIGSLSCEGLDGFRVRVKDVFFKGICENCLKK